MQRGASKQLMAGVCDLSRVTKGIEANMNTFFCYSIEVY
jgi:hypothetical protein